MADDWAAYICNVNSKLASIFVNLGLAPEAPFASKPWLLWIWLYFKTPRPDGLSDSKEAPLLFAIEDALDPLLAQNCGALMCGRITTEGRREFYFYGKTTEGFRETVSKAMAAFQGYRYDVGSQEDSTWNQYFNVLYPSRDQLQRIKNQELLRILVERGDLPSVAREVNHWLYFPSEMGRSGFRDAVAAAGYSINAEMPSEGPLPFGIRVSRTQAIEQDLIDQTVTELLTLASQFEGDYDGWESPVIAQ